MTILAKKFLGFDALGTDTPQRAIYRANHDIWGVQIVSIPIEIHETKDAEIIEDCLNTTIES